jgi:hypothetical protein
MLQRLASLFLRLARASQNGRLATVHERGVFLAVPGLGITIV